MSTELNKQGGNVAAIGIMFMLFFMIAFVTNFAGSMGIIVKNQFGASNMASQLGSAANFFAYFFMGIPGGLILKRKGYKFTALLAVGVGIAGLAVQLASGFVSSFTVYVTGAFVAGFSMCLLNLVVNPLLNTLGGGGNKGNQLVQFGCSLNSIGATLAPMLLGYLIGGEVAKAKVMDAAPAMYIAIGIFVLAFIVLACSEIPEPHLETAEEKANRTPVLKDICETLKFRHFTLGALAIFSYIVIESGIPNMANLYMTAEKLGGAANPGFVGAAVAGSVVAGYWFCMMLGRLAGGALGANISSRTMIAVCSVLGIALMVATMYTPVKMVTVFGKSFPLAMVFMALCGLCTSVMWGGIFNMAAEGLGKYVPMGSGIFMAMVVGGLMLPVQGLVADKVGILNSYWFTIALLSYVLFYALIGSRVAKK
ncbi:MAG: MFS transporter [Kiritimatiellia bacterium]